MLNYIKRHKKRSIIIAVAMVAILSMTFSGTLSYPYILTARQIQMIKYCEFGDSDLKAKTFGFDVAVPSEYCLLPNRLFPRDGSIQVIPKGLYSVLNEYIKGSIVGASKSTLLFEPIFPDRNPETIINSFAQGGFLVEARQSDIVNDNSLKVHIVRNVRGIDPSEHYDWAFVTHPNGKAFLSILLMHTEDPSVFDYIIKNLRPL